MVATVFPRKLLHEVDHDWNIIGNTMVAGQTSGSSVDSRSDGGGFWMASLNNIRLLDYTETLCWRAVRQGCAGGVVPIVVPRNDIVFAPFPGGGTEYGDISHSDGTLFSDDSGYYQNVIDITSGSGNLRDTSLAITINYAASLQGGESFSINHPTFGWRLYEIATVIMATSTAGVISFNPPLREAVTGGTQLEFDRPRCTMKLLNSAAMDLNVTTYPFSLAGVKFVESKYAS